MSEMRREMPPTPFVTKQDHALETGKLSVEKPEWTTKDDDESVKELIALLERGAKPGKIARSLAGINTPSATALREQLHEGAATVFQQQLHDCANNGDILVSLTGIDSEEAHKIRRDEFYSEVYPDKSYFNRSGDYELNPQTMTLDSLSTIDSENAWQLREEALVEIKRQIKIGYWKEHGDRQNLMPGLLNSLIGLDSERAWKMRDEVVGQGDEGVPFEAKYMNDSTYLAGLDSERSWELREGVLNRYPNDVPLSLIGLDTERSWQVRDDFWKKIMESPNTKTTLAENLLLSLVGINSERAWKIRESLFEFVAGPEVPKYPFGQMRGYLARSLAGLNSEHAKQMRVQLEKLGVSPDDIAEGVSGDDQTFIWRSMKKDNKTT